MDQERLKRADWKIESLKAEVAQLKKSNKQLRQRLTRLSYADVAKQWFNFAEWVETEDFPIDIQHCMGSMRDFGKQLCLEIARQARFEAEKFKAQGGSE
jgi:hypothetical protein